MRPPAKRQRSEGGQEQLEKALRWLNSYPKVSKWMDKYDIEELVDRNGGIAQVHDFLPGTVAEGALRILERLPPGRWNDTSASEDYTHNNIAHRFWSVKAGGSNSEALEALLRAFTLLLPGSFNAFSAARYERGHYIAPHDDRAYTPVQLDTGEVVTCSRDLTVIYYLTKGWEAGMGGALVDLEAPPEREPAAPGGRPAPPQHPQQQRQGRLYVPAFNSAVFFRVPRWHSVTPLTTDRPRLSVFGWFLQPGRLYELNTGEGQPSGEQQQQQEGSAAPAAADGAQQPAGRWAGEEPHNGGRKKGTAQRRKTGRRLQEGRPAPEDGPVLHCKLAQRLLAQASTRQKKREQVAGGS